MKDKIVFTHDVEGERLWLGKQIPCSTNIETVSSGKWQRDFPIQTNQGQLYEISYSDHFNLERLLHTDCENIKSFYSHDPEIVFRDNKYWACTNDFVSNVDYQPFVDQPKFWVTHVARSGTVFTETLLRQHRTQFRPHVGVKNNDQEIIDVWRIAKQHPDVALVMVYRPELWETFTSTALSIRYGCHHGNKYNWDLAEAIEISIDDMLNFESRIISTLNFWCNLRSMLPDHSVLLLNGTEMIQKYSHLVDHQRVNYDKQKLISNYKKSKEIWYEHFNARLSVMMNNVLVHLEKMNCKQTLDHLL